MNYKKIIFIATLVTVSSCAFESEESVTDSSSAETVVRRDLSIDNNNQDGDMYSKLEEIIINGSDMIANIPTVRLSSSDSLIVKVKGIEKEESIFELRGQSSRGSILRGWSHLGHLADYLAYNAIFKGEDSSSASFDFVNTIKVSDFNFYESEKYIDKLSDVRIRSNTGQVQFKGSIEINGIDHVKKLSEIKFGLYVMDKDKVSLSKMGNNVELVDPNGNPLEVVTNGSTITNIDLVFYGLPAGKLVTAIEKGNPIILKLEDMRIDDIIGKTYLYSDSLNAIKSSSFGFISFNREISNLNFISSNISLLDAVKMGGLFDQITMDSKGRIVRLGDNENNISFPIIEDEISPEDFFKGNVIISGARPYQNLKFSPGALMLLKYTDISESISSFRNTLTKISEGDGRVVELNNIRAGNVYRVEVEVKGHTNRASGPIAGVSYGQYTPNRNPRTGDAPTPVDVHCHYQYSVNENERIITDFLKSDDFKLIQTSIDGSGSDIREISKGRIFTRDGKIIFEIHVDRNLSNQGEAIRIDFPEKSDAVGSYYTGFLSYTDCNTNYSGFRWITPPPPQARPGKTNTKFRFYNYKYSVFKMTQE